MRLKGIYDPPSRSDGKRILVDRLWPRVFKKDDAKVDEWLRDIAERYVPEIVFGHDPEKWPAFREKVQGRA